MTPSWMVDVCRGPNGNILATCSHGHVVISCVECQPLLRPSPETPGIKPDTIEGARARYLIRLADIEDEDQREARALRGMKRVKKAGIWNQAWVTVYKAFYGCVRCGERHPCCLDLHHVDPATKTFTISEGVRSRLALVVFAEVKKCVVICANCHRKEHYDRRKTESIELWRARG